MPISAGLIRYWKIISDYFETDNPCVLQASNRIMDLRVEDIFIGTEKIAPMKMSHFPFNGSGGCVAAEALMREFT